MQSVSCHLDPGLGALLLVLHPIADDLRASVLQRWDPLQVYCGLSPIRNLRSRRRGWGYREETVGYLKHKLVTSSLTPLNLISMQACAYRWGLWRRWVLWGDWQVQDLRRWWRRLWTGTGSPQRDRSPQRTRPCPWDVWGHGWHGPNVSPLSLCAPASNQWSVCHRRPRAPPSSGSCSPWWR